MGSSMTDMKKLESILWRCRIIHNCFRVGVYALIHKRRQQALPRSVTGSEQSPVTRKLTHKWTPMGWVRDGCSSGQVTKHFAQHTDATPMASRCDAQMASNNLYTP
eukprot:1154596-Pelagomonas_calceolata.AAC.2